MERGRSLILIPEEPEQLKIAADLFPQAVIRGLPDFSCNIHIKAG